MSERPFSVGVLGAGTMGAGIALACLYKAVPVILHDIDPQVLEKAERYITRYLDSKGLSQRLKLLNQTTRLEDFEPVSLVIEAVPENLELKQQLFHQLDQICPPETILATNTSTLSVSRIAAQASRSSRIAGLHFFNPATVMPLVEIIRGVETSKDTIQTLEVLAHTLGKIVIQVKDTPGFLVNRLARPFYGEPLRMLGEGVARIKEMDRIIESAGFKMGPFRLMDLIGIDVNYNATRSLYDQTFGEARYRPHWIQARMVAQGALGVKSGRGFYNYEEGNAELEQSEILPTSPDARMPLLGTEGTYGKDLLWVCNQAGYRIVLDDDDIDPQLGLVLAGRTEGVQDALRTMDARMAESIPIFCQVADITLSEVILNINHPERVVGLNGLLVGPEGTLTLVSNPSLNPPILTRAEKFTRSLGLEPVWITDSPGLVLPRLLACLANEAAFVVQEDIAGPNAIETAATLGLNYPLGPLAWTQKIGIKRLFSVLEHLHREFGEERYRPSPVFRRWVESGVIPGLG